MTFEEMFRNLGKGLDEFFGNIWIWLASIPSDKLHEILEKQGYNFEEAESIIKAIKKWKA